MTLVCNGTNEWPSHSSKGKYTTPLQQRNRRMAVRYLSQRFGRSGGVGNVDSQRIMQRDVAFGDCY